jgi:hypothetical protein
VKDFVLSPLNIATTERYKACLADGGHIPSDKVILRDIGYIDSAPFIVCSRCQVPFAKRANASYNGKALALQRTAVAA